MDNIGEWKTCVHLQPVERWCYKKNLWEAKKLHSFQILEHCTIMLPCSINKVSRTITCLNEFDCSTDGFGGWGTYYAIQHWIPLLRRSLDGICPHVSNMEFWGRHSFLRVHMDFSGNCYGSLDGTYTLCGVYYTVL